MQKALLFLEKWSLPLILGIITSLTWANLDSESYQHFLHAKWFFGADIHFLVNDVFLVLFFGQVMIEIVHELAPEGAFNPIKKAIPNLVGAVGGVLLPIVLFFSFNRLFGEAAFDNGWAIGTATDIAVALLFARFIFPKKHPAITFLLFLAVVDDLIGLGIIAAFYPDVQKPVMPEYLFLVFGAVLLSLFLRKIKTKTYLPYAIPAGLSWFGMFMANLHPSLALIWIVPFISGEKGEKSPLHKLEHHLKPIVTIGLFFFGLTNAGVAFGNISTLTWIILTSLVLGKFIGIISFVNICGLFGFKLNSKIGAIELLLISMVSGVGLTVSLFIADIAYIETFLKDAAKMGALLSLLSGFCAIALAKTVFRKHRF